MMYQVLSHDDALSPFRGVFATKRQAVGWIKTAKRFVDEHPEKGWSGALILRDVTDAQGTAIMLESSRQCADSFERAMMGTAIRQDLVESAKKTFAKANRLFDEIDAALASKGLPAVDREVDTR